MTVWVQLGMNLWKWQLKMCVTQIESQTYLHQNDYGPKWLSFFWKAFHFGIGSRFSIWASILQKWGVLIFFFLTQFLVVFKKQMERLRICVLQWPHTSGFLDSNSRNQDLFYLWNICFPFLCFKTLSAYRNPSSYWKPVMTSSSKC